jgi:hypothetical protein
MVTKHRGRIIVLSSMQGKHGTKHASRGAEYEVTGGDSTKDI